MAKNFTETKVVQGDEDPASSDGLCSNLALFPIGTIYINSVTGKTFVRNAGNRVAADWVSQEAGGSSLLPTTGTGTATGAIVGELDGNGLSIQQGGNNFLSIDPTAGGETSILRAYNTTGGDNDAYVDLRTTNGSGQFAFQSSFNGEETVAQLQGNASSGLAGFELNIEAGGNQATIEGSADATSSSITHAADVHTFNGKFHISTQTPASASAAGTAGQIAWDSSYIYVCTATNTWKRVAIATW